MGTNREYTQKPGATLAVVFTCEQCGRTVEIINGEAGPEISDAEAFLDQHRECLRQRDPSD